MHEFDHRTVQVAQQALLRAAFIARQLKPLGFLHQLESPVGFRQFVGCGSVGQVEAISEIDDRPDDKRPSYPVRMALVNGLRPLVGTLRAALPEVDAGSKPVVFVAARLKMVVTGNDGTPQLFIASVESQNEGRLRLVEAPNHSQPPKDLASLPLLFMIPADSKDIKTEYGILLNELKKYNPELLDKKRMLAITKSDMLDAELKAEMRKDVPSELPVIFISAVTNQGISELKDLIWKNLH